jgi:hypothetical protein
MRKSFFPFAIILLLTVATLCNAQTMPNGGDFSSNPKPEKLPTNVILVKGAWSSASDSITPLPESGSFQNNVYTNPYFGLRYVLTPEWTQNYDGPPPSDSGYYVLAQIRPTDNATQSARGSILITAQDMFFSLTGADTATELVKFRSDNLQADYKLEMAPTEVHLANRDFVRFDYGSPIAELHWYVLTTQIRCHAVQFIFTSRDTKLLEDLIRGMNTVELPAGASVKGGTAESDLPVCIRDYANSDNVLERENPILTERRFNSIPVRIIIDKQGKVKHIHFLSAFPEQSKAITDALMQWRFRPYLKDGKPADVETGIMFGRAPRLIKSTARSEVND